MKTSKKADSQTQLIVDLFSNYFGTDVVPGEGGSGDIRFETLARHFRMIEKPVEKVQQLINLFDKFNMTKKTSLTIIRTCFSALFSRHTEVWYSHDHIEIAELQVKIEGDFRDLIKNLEELEKRLATVSRKPFTEKIAIVAKIDFTEKIKVAADLRSSISKIKIYFDKIFRSEAKPLDRSISLKQREKPSGQDKAHPESFKKAVVAIRDILTNELESQSDEIVVKPWQESGEKGKGFGLDASQKTLEILRCFGIDMKSAKNIVNLDYRKK